MGNEKHKRKSKTAAEAVVYLRQRALALDPRDVEAVCVLIDHVLRLEQTLDLIMSAYRSAIGRAPEAAILSVQK